MVERGDGARLLLETPARISVSRARAGHNLDGDDAIEAGVASFVDLAHRTGAECGGDFVGAESRSRK